MTATATDRNPLLEFLRLESAAGLALLVPALIAMLVANSPLAGHYERLLTWPIEIRFGPLGLTKPLLLWINDGLMAVFFLLVGLELKRELVEGHLSSLRQASLPLFAAAGGMLVPALVYTAMNRGNPEAMRGWAIPTATDIAFALGMLAFLGNRVPSALKALLLSIAIFDDLGAIVVIALFYTSQLSLLSLLVAATLVVGLAILNRAGVRRPAAYFLLGLPLWIAVLKSGVHATLAGVILALFIPIREGPEPGATPPLRQLEDALHPWVAFGVLPLFAFANAGVSLNGLAIRDVLHPVPFGIIAGLLVGKQLGVLAGCWLGVRSGAAELPEGVGWRAIHGIGLLSGIGFTMSLFIASLAFEQGSGAEYLGLERLGILIGSLAAAVGGLLVLRSAMRAGSGGGTG